MAELYPHQIDAISSAVVTLRDTGGFYLNHDPGMGKSLSAIGVARILKARSVLILAPVVAIGVWAGTETRKGEIQKWWPGAIPKVLRGEDWISAGVHLSGMTSVTGEMDLFAPCLNPDTNAPVLVVTNYDQLTGKNGEKRLRRLLRMEFDLLVLDEAQFIKSPNAQRTRAVYKIAKGIQYKLLLSGTPAHSPLDWWSQYRVVAPREPMWAQRYGDYKKMIAVFGGPSSLWVVGFRPEAKAFALQAMEPYTHVAKVDILNLPEPIFTQVPIELSKAERAAYEQMKRDLIVEIDSEEKMSAQIVLTKMLRLQQITAGHLQPHNVLSSKLRASLDLIEERPYQKIIVACRFKWELDKLNLELQNKRSTMSIRGETHQEDRSSIEHRFQTDDKPYVLLLQYRAGGMALTLTAADTLIIYSFELSYIAYQQMIGRVYRIGSTTHCQILPLLAVDTTDETVYDVMQRKGNDEDLAKLLMAEVRR